MATALEVLTEPAKCLHGAFVPYTIDGASTDDTVTEKGRCIDCGHWFELWIARTTGEAWHERELAYAEIRALREANES